MSTCCYASSAIDGKKALAISGFCFIAASTPHASKPSENWSSSAFDRNDMVKRDSLNDIYFILLLDKNQRFCPSTVIYEIKITFNCFLELTFGG